MSTTRSRGRWSRGLWVPVLALVALLASGTWLVTQQSGSGWGMGSGWGERGTMGGSGYDGMMGDYGWSEQDAEPVDDLDQARDQAAGYAEVVQPGLEVGEVMRFDNHYYADLQESDGTLVTEVLIDPRSGAVRPEMGPATMWNTRAGMMGRSGGSDAEITAAQAQQIADDWLADRGDGVTSDDPAQFPGYYTLHTLQDGEITGMLSVHDTTGDVWYHSWHDDFVEMSGHS
ncbi:hypothetical protein BH23ACT6_BH23ACT6_12920 [soil metagenome]